MTGPEREDFRELRQEMREGFRDVKEALEKLNDRTGSLELTRAAAAAADEVRKGSRAYAVAERRWRIGVVVSVGVAIALGVINVILAVAQP